MSDGSYLLEFPALIPNEPGPNRYATITLARVSADGVTSDTVGAFRDRFYRYDASAPSRVRNIRLAYSFMYTFVGGTLYGGNAAGPWMLRVASGQAPYTMRGRPAARIALPGSARVAFLASDRVGLIETDEMGVQYVRVYDIVKPADDDG